MTGTRLGSQALQEKLPGLSWRSSRAAKEKENTAKGRAKEMTEKDKAQKERSSTKMLLAKEKDSKAVENEAATNAEKKDILLETALFWRLEWRTEAQQS